MSDSSKGKKIGFIVLTGLLVVTQGASGIMDLLGVEDIVKGLTTLGYPAYLALILGPAKLAGVTVLALPKLPRLKEWAYAGFSVDFLGAFASHILHGDGPDLILPSLIAFFVLMGSYTLRPSSRRLAG